MTGTHAAIVDSTRQQRDASLLALYAARLTRPVIYCDVGALGGTAITAVRELNRRGQLQIVGFEPDETECNRLTAANPHNTYFPFCLGNEDGQRTFRRTRFGACSSFLRPNLDVIPPGDPHRSLFEVIEEKSITCARYDTLRKERGAPAVDYLKIDTQGFDLCVLQGFGRELDHVMGIEIEVCTKALYHDAASFGEIHRYLTESVGFILRDLRAESIFGYELVAFDAYFSRPRQGLDTAALARLVLWDFLHDMPPGRTIEISNGSVRFVSLL